MSPTQSWCLSLIFPQFHSLMQVWGYGRGHAVGKGTLGTAGALMDSMLCCGPKLALGCLEHLSNIPGFTEAMGPFGPELLHTQRHCNMQ